MYERFTFKLYINIKREVITMKNHNIIINENPVYDLMTGEKETGCFGYFDEYTITANSIDEAVSKAMTQYCNDIGERGIYLEKSERCGDTLHLE